MSVSVSALLGVTPQKNPMIVGLPVCAALLPSIVKSRKVIFEFDTPEGVRTIPVTPVDPAASWMTVTPMPMPASVELLTLMLMQPLDADAGAGTMYVPACSCTLPPPAGSAAIAALMFAWSVAPVLSPDGGLTHTVLVSALAAAVAVVCPVPPDAMARVADRPAAVPVVF